MAKFCITIILIIQIFLQSCGAFNTLDPRTDIYTLGLDKYDGISLPQERRGSLNFTALGVDSFMIILLVGFVFLAVDISTGRLFNEKLADEVENSIDDMQIKNSPYAYVITKSYGTTQWTNTNVSYNNTYNFNNKLTTTNDYVIIKINPGRYTMTALNYVKNNRSYFLYETDKKINEKLKNSTPLFGYFEVEAGKLYYLGDINIVYSHTGFSLEIQTNKWAMINRIQNNYKKLANKSDLIIDNYIILNPRIVAPKPSL